MPKANTGGDTNSDSHNVPTADRPAVGFSRSGGAMDFVFVFRILILLCACAL